MHRRDILRALCSTPLAGALVPGLHFQVASAQDSASYKGDTLVVVFLRGGADGLQLVAPIDDRDYIQARPPALRLTETSNGSIASAIRISKGFSDQDWRIHSSLAPLRELIESDQAQILHACGLANATRSHFEAQEILESGGKRSSPAAAGWLAPHIKKTQGLRFVGVSRGEIESLSGSTGGLNLSGELRSALSLPGELEGQKVLEALYSQGTEKVQHEDPVVPVARQTLELMQSLDNKLTQRDARQPYAPSNGITYNTENSEWLQATQMVAQLIRLDVGLQVACLDFGGWDTHENQPGRINNLARQFAANIRALFDDVVRSNRHIHIVVMSEFGRRVKSNASLGTDHGHGGILWSIDSRSRKLLPATQWPGLSNQQLDQGLDLRATTDVSQALHRLAEQVLI